MTTVTIEVPDDAFSALRRSPKEFARDMRLAAAIQWYHQGLISQGKAAEIAGAQAQGVSGGALSGQDRGQSGRRRRNEGRG